LRIVNPHTPRIMPPAAEPNAPIMPMKRSAMPCIDARSAGESASVSSALPATNAKFHPTPLRNRPRMTSARSLPGASPASITAPISTSAPTPIIGSRPRRSHSHPDSGEATYMPPRWRDTATPIVCTV
jgi:hypothetical protein